MTLLKILNMLKISHLLSSLMMDWVHTAKNLHQFLQQTEATRGTLSLHYLELMIHHTPELFPASCGCEDYLGFHRLKADCQLLQIPALYCYEELQMMQRSLE